MAFIEQLDPIVKFGASVVALLVGVATLTYYSLAAVEKWKAIKAMKDVE